jgi:hypothetical protein
VNAFVFRFKRGAWDGNSEQNNTEIFTFNPGRHDSGQTEVRQTALRTFTALAQKMGFHNALTLATCGSLDFYSKLNFGFKRAHTLNLRHKSRRVSKPGESAKIPSFKKNVCGGAAPMICVGPERFVL